MRNLKRVLGLALASVMVLSMMVVGASAANYDDFTDKDEIVNTEAVSVLVELGVIAGKDDGSYDPTGIVTRAEMAKMICVVLNGGSDPSLGSTSTHTYTDTVGHWAEAYIEYCTQLGIVAGDGAGKFNPNNTVTATEAAKMLLVALGYNASFEGMVGANWAISTNVLANQNKLYGGLSIDVDAGLTRDNAAQMAYNALNCEMVAYTYALVTGADGSLTSIPRVEKKDDTLLSEKFGGVRVEGVVVSNEQTSANFEGKTRIAITNADELAKVGHNFTSETSSNATFEVSTDASLRGTSVFFYVVPSVASPKNSEKAVVLGSVMDSGKNVVVSTTKTFGADGISGFEKDNDIEYDGVTYYVDGKTASKSDVASQKTGWETKFIDSDNDGKTEYVVQTRYSFGKVTKYSTKDDGSLTIDTYADSKDYKSEKIVGFEDVELNDYVVYNTMGGKLYVAVAETVTGTLETYKANSNRLKANLTVDGTSYTFSEAAAYNKDSELKLPDTYLDGSYMGKEVTLYMDKFGYVAAASDVQGFTDYAYIANVSDVSDSTALSSSVRVYAALADGTEGSYIVDSLYEANGDEVATFDKTDIDAKIYGYYVTSDDKLQLTKVAATDVATSKPVKFEKGSASLKVDGATATTVDSDTVFFYIFQNADASGIKSIETYVGKDKAPTVDMTTATGATYANAVSYADKDGDGVADVVVFTTKQVTSTNVLFLYNYVKSTGDNAIYDAVIDGELVEGITVDSKLTNLAGKPYTYTINGKGVYQVTANPATTISGVVTLVDGSSVIVEELDGTKTEVKVVTDTTIAEIDGSDTAIISGVTKNDFVTVVYNASTDDATGIYLIERYSTDNTSVLAINETVITEATGVYDYTLANNTTTVAQAKAAIQTSYGASVYFTVGEPTGTDAEKIAYAKANKVADGTTLDASSYYMSVVSEDGYSISIYEVEVTSGSTTNAETPVISVDLNSTETGSGSPVALTVTVTPVSDGGTLSYKWEKSSDGSTGWSEVGTDSNTYSVDAEGYYKVTVTNTNNSVNGNKTVSVESTICHVTGTFA